MAFRRSGLSPSLCEACISSDHLVSVIGVSFVQAAEGLPFDLQEALEALEALEVQTPKAESTMVTAIWAGHVSACGDFCPCLRQT